MIWKNKPKKKVTLAIEYARYWNATIRVLSVLLRDKQEIKDKLVRNLNQVEKFIQDANLNCTAELLTGEKGKGLAESILDYEKKI